MGNNTDLETLFLEIITEERVIRLNRAIQLVFGGKIPGGAIYSEENEVVFVTKEGVIKKTNLDEFKNINKNRLQIVY